MTNIMYLDAETQRWSTEVKGEFDNIPDFKLSLLCTYDTINKKYRTWMQHTIPELQTLICKMDLIIGFNIIGFDYVLLQQYFSISLENLPTFDILQEVQDAYNGRLSLNNLCKYTLDLQKLGDGAKAVQWWKECELELLEKYCRRDVEATKKLFEHGCKNNKISFFDPNKKELDILSTEHWAVKARSIIEEKIPF